MTQTPSLQFAAYRFILRAADPIHLPPNAGSTLRGGFGSSFKRTACFQRSHGVEGCGGCSVAHTCPYGYIFETRLPPESEVLRSQREIPHPFVLEPPADPPPLYEPGAALGFRVILVGRAIAYLPFIVLAFIDLGRRGVGRGRGRFHLEEVRAEHPLDHEWETVYRDGSLMPCATDLTAAYADLLRRCEGEAPERVAVRFLTPTRLVSSGRLVLKPDFPVLVRAALRRLSALSYFHCGRRWDADYRGMVANAERVGTVTADVRWVDWERYSGRQDTRMKLGGLVGSAVYEGPVGPLLPVLLGASVAHVGKACSFGNGRIAVEW